MLKSVLITKFTIPKLEFVTVLLVLERSMELVKSVQLEELQLLMDHAEAVVSTNNSLMVNVFVFQDSFQTPLKSVLNAVMLMELS